MNKRCLLLLSLVVIAAGAGCSQAPPPVVAAPAARPVAEATSPDAATQTPLGAGPLVVENQVDVTAQRTGMITENKSFPKIRPHQVRV